MRGTSPSRKRRPGSLYRLDEAVRAEGFPRLCGVDEAGRGPLAGPVVAAAVVFDPLDVPEGLDDSKKLTPERRSALEGEITARALSWAVGAAEAGEIDTLNILRASLLAMERAVGALAPPPAVVLIDGIHSLGLGLPQRTIVGGDARSASIAAASILAKEHRDRLMRAHATAFPGYGFELHMGYATAEHREALARLGPSPIHRRTFKGVRELLRPTPRTGDLFG